MNPKETGEVDGKHTITTILLGLLHDVNASMVGMSEIKKDS
jgi:hypothetical protein